MAVSSLGRLINIFSGLRIHVDGRDTNHRPGKVALGLAQLDGRSPHLGAANKCEHWRSIDLADSLKPIVGDRIRAITWKNDYGGFDSWASSRVHEGRPIRQARPRTGSPLVCGLHLHTHDVWPLPQVVRMPWLPGAHPDPLMGQQPAVSAVPED